MIADTANNWVSLDSAPGISRDGRVIAFQGNPNALARHRNRHDQSAREFSSRSTRAPGFGNAKIIRITGGKVEDVAADRAAIKGNYDGVCDIGEICKPAAELGFDGAGNPITIRLVRRR